MAIATHHRHARLGNTQLRTDDVNNALVGMSQAIEFNAEGYAVFFQGFHLLSGQFFGDG